MKSLVLFVSLTAFVSAGTVPEYSKSNPIYGYMTRFGIPEAERIRKAEEASLSNLSSRIVGGNHARQGQIPYQAGIISDIVGTHSRGVCGGTLISAGRILTAAHCWFDGRNIAWRLTIVLGSVYLFHGGTRLTTSAVVSHPDFSPWLIRNDIAVVYLLNPVTFSDTIYIAPLPSGNQLTDNFANRQATTSGFGLTDNAETITANQVKSYARVNVIGNGICNVAYPTIIQDHHICTSTLWGAGPSQGDSGGPLVTESGGRLVLIGVTSFGSALPLSLPSVYTRVTSFIDFIRNNL